MNNTRKSKKEWIAYCQRCGDFTFYSNNVKHGRRLCPICYQFEFGQKKRPVLSKKMRQAIIKEFDGKCFYCREKATTVDHKIPICRGGTEELENLVACCHSCNAKKTYKTPREFHAYLTSQK